MSPKKKITSKEPAIEASSGASKQEEEYDSPRAVYDDTTCVGRRPILRRKYILGTSLFWTHAYFEKGFYFGHRPIFGERYVLRKDLFLGRKT